MRCLLRSASLWQWLILALSCAPALSARAEAPAACSEPCGRILVLESAVAAGAQVGKVRHEYQSSEGPDTSGAQHASSAFGELRLSAGARLGGHFALGGYLGLGRGGEPRPFADGTRGELMTSLGAQLTLLQAPNAGFFVSLRGGGVWMSGERGPTLGATAGYLVPLWPRGSLGIGADVTVRWYRWAEEGDAGTYHYRTQLWAPGLVVGLRVL